MVFSSPLFLFVFLPLALLGYYIAPKSLRNAMLFACSLLFYAWGERLYLIVLLVSLVVNFWLARRIAATSRKRGHLIGGLVFNLGLLFAFKYLHFVGDVASTFWMAFGGCGFSIPAAHLPIGISFFTFQAVSYIVDVYRRDIPAQERFLPFGLYVFLFPHLIAGPIVRYRDLAEQLDRRQESVELFAEGIRRFIVGLAKKLLLANTLASTADALFLLPPGELSAGAAWLGLWCYSLQIYFDFSGYTDMAIGLGKMFGFTFLENFRYPYVATSLTDFWRRWHISLSTWFRDYLYIPLGGNRTGDSRIYLNLLIVFACCGLWHGANWTFLIWGLWHGLFLIVERLGVSRLLDRSGSIPRHAYLLMVVMLGWVFFRCNTLADAGGFLRALVGQGNARYVLADFWNREVAVGLFVGSLACLPIVPWLTQWKRKWADRAGPTLVWDGAWSLAATAALAFLLFGSTVRLAAETYQPFIYFRF